MTFSCVRCTLQESKKILYLSFSFCFYVLFCLVWFLTSPGQLRTRKQFKSEGVAELSRPFVFFNFKSQEKMLQKRFPVSLCQECPTSTLQIIRNPWSLLIKRKWFSIQSNQIITADLEGLGFRCQQRFGVEFWLSYRRSSFWAWIFVLFFKAQQNPLSGDIQQLHSWNSCKLVSLAFLSWIWGSFQGLSRKPLGTRKWSLKDLGSYVGLFLWNVVFPNLSPDWNLLCSINKS